jgi:hypothetical protein
LPQCKNLLFPLLGGTGKLFQLGHLPIIRNADGKYICVKFQIFQLNYFRSIVGKAQNLKFNENDIGGIIRSRARFDRDKNSTIRG